MPDTAELRDLKAAPVGVGDLELHRRELTGYCQRIVGASEADDAVQETMLRAWRASADFAGRSSVRAWLYQIAANTCLDLLRGRERRGPRRGARGRGGGRRGYRGPGNAPPIRPSSPPHKTACGARWPPCSAGCRPASGRP